MAHWNSAQGQANMVKTNKKLTYLWHSPGKPQTQNEKFFFMSTSRLAESA